MHAIKQQDWQELPEKAQQEVYDFFLKVKQRYESNEQDYINSPAFLKEQARLKADLERIDNGTATMISEEEMWASTEEAINNPQR